MQIFIAVGSETNTTETNTGEQAINWREEERKNGPDKWEAKLEVKILFP